MLLLKPFKWVVSRSQKDLQGISLHHWIVTRDDDFSIRFKRNRTHVRHFSLQGMCCQKRQAPYPIKPYNGTEFNAKFAVDGIDLAGIRTFIGWTCRSFRKQKKLNLGVFSIKIAPIKSKNPLLIRPMNHTCLRIRNDMRSILLKNKANQGSRMVCAIQTVMHTAHRR